MGTVVGDLEAEGGLGGYSCFLGIGRRDEIGYSSRHALTI
jgi:hypothetical protein